MNRTSIRASIKLQPFKPFIIRLANGELFNVDEPEIIALSPTQEIAIIFTTNSYHVIDTTKVVSLEVI